MTTGLAVYPGYQGSPIPGNLALAMGRHEFAAQFRQLNPQGYLILRADDGNDEGQYNDVGTNPATEAQRYYDRFIYPALSRVPANTYNAVLGPCETWHPDKLLWRADFELALCNLVQPRLHYIALSCPTGNLDADQVMLFAEVFRQARWISYHGYLGANMVWDADNNTIAITYRSKLSQEVDNWWLWRPTRIWWPVLKAAGIPLRLLYTEIGTGPRPEDVGLSKEQLAQLDVLIAGALEAECRGKDIEFGGALPFAFGAEGNMGANWNLDGHEHYFVEEVPPVTIAWTLGFASYAKAYPEVGTAIEDLQYDNDGNAWQHSDKGLLFWHKAANKIYWFVRPKA